MAASATTELIRGTSITAKRYGDSQFTDVVVCKGLTTTHDFPTMEAAAREAASPSLDTLGSEHDVKSNYFLDNVRTEIISPTSVRMYATYKSYPSAEFRFEVFGSLYSKAITADINGNGLYVARPADLADTSQVAGYNEEAIALAPQMVVRMSMIGFGSRTPAQAVSESGLYTGYLNSNIFLGGDPGTWLVTKFQMSKTNYDGYFPWTRVIEIQYDPAGWKVFKPYRLSDGRIASDQDSSSAKYFDIYGERTFPSMWLTGM